MKRKDSGNSTNKRRRQSRTPSVSAVPRRSKYSTSPTSQITPMSGFTKDWSGKNTDKILNSQREYAIKILQQQQQGPPDFNSLFKSLGMKTIARANRK